MIFSQEEPVPVESPAVVEKSVDEKINDAVQPYTDAVSKVVFVPVYEGEVEVEGNKVKLSIPFVLLWLAGGAIFFTFFFKFINFFK